MDSRRAGSGRLIACELIVHAARVVLIESGDNRCFISRDAAVVFVSRVNILRDTVEQTGQAVDIGRNSSFETRASRAPRDDNRIH